MQEADLDPGQFQRLMGFVQPLLVELETARERQLATDYVLGLLGPSERKTPEPIVRTQLGVDSAPARERRLQAMLSDGSWNHRSLTLLGAERLMREHDVFAAYTLDDTAILKQGKHSVGVANQYAGCRGGLANCQAVVTAGMASEHVSALLAAQLYLPDSWCGEAARARRKECHIPERIQHKTKLELGLSIIRDTADWELPKLPWLCDSGYGDSAPFRAELAKMGHTYVAGASMRLTMWPVGTTFSRRQGGARKGRSLTRLTADSDRKPMSIPDLAAELPPDAWKNVLWRHGSRGPQRGRFAAVRVRPAHALVGNNAWNTIRPEGLQEEQWLLIHWPADNARPTKAWLSNLPADTDLVRLVSLARLRWRIERDHEEGKAVLGFDHYEGRTWAGLHHHLALAIVAEQFLAHERLHETKAAQAAVPPWDADAARAASADADADADAARAARADAARTARADAARAASADADADADAARAARTAAVRPTAA